jgi:hypothetical protein
MRCLSTVDHSVTALGSTLGVTFKEDQSRLRTGHGGQEHGRGPPLCSYNLVWQCTDKRSIKRRRTYAAFDPRYLTAILGPVKR